LRRTLFVGLLLTVVLETLTCFLRFAVQLQSTRDTRLLAQATFGFRIHHGYIGLCLLVVALWAASKARRNLLLIVGVALVLSDLLHHFAILWFVVGAPQFDLRYPGW
jgi:hypothetical protein